MFICVGGFVDGGSVFDDYEDGEKMSIFDWFIDLIFGIFMLMLGVLCVVGMIKGFVVMFVVFNWLLENLGIYKIFYLIGDGFFYFLLIVLGLIVVKKFYVD